MSHRHSHRSEGAGRIGSTGTRIHSNGVGVAAAATATTSSSAGVAATAREEGQKNENREDGPPYYELAILPRIPHH